MVTTIRLDALAAARRGAIFLDEREPGWRDEISLDKLDMGDGYKCILGQVYASESNNSWDSGYSIGRARLFDYDLKEASKFGFTTAHADYTNEELTDAWKHLLETEFDPKPNIDMDAFIDKHAKDLEQIYEARTAGDFTFHGFMYMMLKDLESRGVQLP